MYMLSRGCLLISYKAFFHLHTWFCLSCVSTPTGCKCLFVVYAFFSWEASCYESCLVSHDVSIYYMMELQTSLHVSILHPRHHSSWTGLPFLLGGWKVLHQWCHCTRHIILHFEMSSLVLWNKFRPSLLAGDYVCDLSYKSNAFVWLEHLIWNIHTSKYLCINIWSCNYFSQYNIHPYLTETF